MDKVHRIWYFCNKYVEYMDEFNRYAMEHMEHEPSEKIWLDFWTSKGVGTEAAGVIGCSM